MRARTPAQLTTYMLQQAAESYELTRCRRELAARQQQELLSRPVIWRLPTAFERQEAAARRRRKIAIRAAALILLLLIAALAYWLRGPGM